MKQHTKCEVLVVLCKFVNRICYFRLFEFTLSVYTQFFCSPFLFESSARPSCYWDTVLLVFGAVNGAIHCCLQKQEISQFGNSTTGKTNWQLVSFFSANRNFLVCISFLRSHHMFFNKCHNIFVSWKWMWFFFYFMNSIVFGQFSIYQRLFFCFFE